MTSARIVRIATRKSALALWQANTVKSLLEGQGIQVELNLVVTSGDKMQRGALAEVSLDDPNLPAHLKTGKGLFVKEVQEEILAGRADLAVHSMKDLPVETTQGLHVAAVLPRANPADVIIFSPDLLRILKDILGANPLQKTTLEVFQALKSLDWTGLKPVGTTSARRQGFLRDAFAGAELDLRVLRGNVDTRLGRAEANEFSFIMLARAGIDRLNLYHTESMLTLPAQLSTPAPAQGIVAIECRDNDAQLKQALSVLNHPHSSLSAAFERTVLWLTGGNCHTALAVHLEDRNLTSWAEARGLRSSLQMTLELKAFEDWQTKARTSNHAQLFDDLRRSSLARSLHTQLLNSGYDKLMTLRTPDSSE